MSFAVTRTSWLLQLLPTIRISGDQQTFGSCGKFLLSIVRHSMQSVQKFGGVRVRSAGHGVAAICACASLSAHLVESVEVGLSVRRFSTENLRKTALYDEHVKLGGKMVPFAGYSLPVQYKDSIINSHLHCRKSCSLFDVSHMGQLRISGSLAIPFVESVTVADVQALKVDQARLSSLTTESGGMIDDCMVTRKSDHVYMVINAGCKEKDLKHLNEQLKRFNAANKSNVNIEIQSDTHELLALQGPKAAEVLEKVLSVSVKDFPFMFSRQFLLDGQVKLGVSRSGYTGEDGFEVSVPRDLVSKLFHRFLADERCLAAGLGVRDSLRLEAGLCLYGHEMTEDISPIQAGLAWTITKRRREQGGFPGHAKIMEQLKTGVSNKRIGFQVGKGAPPARDGAELTDDAGQKIGWVTSGTFSPSLNAAIGMGYVKTELAKEGNKIKVVVRGKAHPVEIVKMPFVPNRYYKL